MHTRVVQGAPVDGRAQARDVEDRGLQLDHVRTLHARDVGQPTRGASRSQADDERAMHLRTEQSPQQPAHDLGGGVVARVAVDLPVDHEGEAGEGLHGDAALDTFALPEDETARIVEPGAIAVGSAQRPRTEGHDASHAYAAVPPGGGRAGKGEERNRDRGRADEREGKDGRRAVGSGQERGQGEGHEHQRGRTPASGCGEKREQAEAAGEGARDPPDRVPEVGEPDVAGDTIAAPAEQRDQERELGARHGGRGQDHDPGHDRPSLDVTPEARARSGAEPQREQGQPVSDRVGNGEAGRLGQAREGEGGEARTAPSDDERVGEAAEGDTGQGHRQHEPERVDGAAEDGPQHAVPHQLHEEEREPDDGGGHEHEPRRGRDRAVGGRTLVGDRGHAHDPRAGQDGRHQGHQEVGQAGQPQGMPRAERLEHEERGGQATRHRAHRVHSVQDRGGAPRRVALLLDRARRRAQRSARQHGRHEEHQRGQDQAGERAELWSQGGRTPEGDVGLADQRQEPGRHRGRGRDEGFEPSVEQERVGVAIGARPDQPTAQAQPAHEHRHHRGGGGGGSAEDEPELARPSRLIREGAGSGGEEQGRDEDQGDGPAAGRRRGCKGAVRTHS